MELTKATENLTFTTHYEDGSKKEIKEGVLFGFNNDNTIDVHIGTNKPEAIAALVPASIEMISTLGITHMVENQLINHSSKSLTRSALHNMNVEKLESAINEIKQISNNEKFRTTILTAISAMRIIISLLQEKGDK